jgi:hypothetical protein
MSYLNRKNFTLPKTIVAYSTGNFNGVSATIDGSNIPQDTYGNRLIEEGTLVAKVNNQYRLAPLAKTLTPIVSATTTVIGVDPVEVFQVGDKVSLLYGSGSITLSGQNVGSTAIITLGTYKLTVTLTSAVRAEALAQIQDAINYDPILKNNIFVIANSANANSLFVSDIHDELTTLSFGLSTDSTVTGTVSPSTLNPSSTYLGTIASINGINSTITLASAVPTLSATLPIGVTIGINCEVKGILPVAYEFSDKVRQNVALLTESSGVYQQRLTYFDPKIGKQLPKIKFDTKF